jgi:hypothetical protein
MSNNEIELIDLDSSIESLEPQEIEMIDLVSEDEQEVELLQPIAGPSGVGMLPNMLRFRNPPTPENGGVIYNSSDLDSSQSSSSRVSVFNNRTEDFNPSPIPSTTYTIEYTETESESDFEVEIVQPVADPADGNASIELDSHAQEE